MREIVQQALSSGYLSIAAQNQMQLLLLSNYDSDDLDALIILQRAVVAGDVEKESRGKKTTLSTTGREAAANIKLAYQTAAELAFAAAVALSMPKSKTEHPS